MAAIAAPTLSQMCTLDTAPRGDTEPLPARRAPAPNGQALWAAAYKVPWWGKATHARSKSSGLRGMRLNAESMSAFHR